MHRCGCRIFVINFFYKNINDFVSVWTQIFELCVDSEVNVYRDTLKKDIQSFWIYVKIGYENFSFHISW